MNHLKTKIEVAGIGTVEVSTIDLAHMGARGNETCLFWSGGSEVVDWYSTWREAEAMHPIWCKPEHIANAIKNHNIERELRESP